MLTVKNPYVGNMEGAFRGMRNPMNSWDKSDGTVTDGVFVPGEADLDLACRLIKAGTDHRKFLRQIQVCIDIDAPMFWWKEFDTYKVATVRNSCSTMHKIHSKPLSFSDFSVHALDPESALAFYKIIERLNQLRDLFNSTKEKTYWRQMIELLPSSFNQLSTVTLNYETLMNIYFARKNHKLTEWHTFCNWVENLPYMRDFISCIL